MISCDTPSQLRDQFESLRILLLVPVLAEELLVTAATRREERCHLDLCGNVREVQTERTPCESDGVPQGSAADDAPHPLPAWRREKQKKEMIFFLQ